ncbi:MAG: endopeptidase La, partial [Candidatus Aminicenantes bacterium]|nr:endopeptidase La [Candidatus Aminicenantes bacterium]
TAALMEVLDPEQNNAFLDHYLDTEFDLSNVMFLVTANIIEPIPRPLVDRMEIIHLPGYTEEEKLQIAKKFLIPKQMKEHGLKMENFRLSDNTIKKIIREYTREAGVRNLEREITSICRKMVKKVVTKNKDYKESITVKKLEKYLGIPRFRRAAISQEDEIGAAVGMAWTEFGGELLTFEVTKCYGKGNFTLTGQLGDIMQESAQAAFSYVKGKLCELNISEDVYKNFDIHIHVPEGATPKEGPSAGITIATSILSLFLSIPVNRKVAMSGEITLKGKVLPIGGIKEKLLAAHREGFRSVILPAENKPDLKDVPKNIKEDMTIHFVENINEVLKIALVKPVTNHEKKEQYEEEDPRKPPLTQIN